MKEIKIQRGSWWKNRTTGERVRVVDIFGNRFSDEIKFQAESGGKIKSMSILVFVQEHKADGKVF